MNDTDKLRILLPHWIEHNQGHGQEFAQWAQKIAATGNKEAAKILDEAARALTAVDENLAKALDILGGPLREKKHEHHHHDGHHHNHHH